MSRAKYNRSVSENRAISQRIDELRMQGLVKKRAVAASFRQFKDGELRAKVQAEPAIPKKSRQEVALIKATIAAADELRRRRAAEKKKMERREMLEAGNDSSQEGRQTGYQTRAHPDRETDKIGLCV